MTQQDPVEGRQRETNLEITTKQDRERETKGLVPVEGRQRETDLEITTELHPVEGRQGRQRNTNLEIKTEQDPV